jgi:WD40 repeat protein
MYSIAFDRPSGTRLFTGHTDGTIKGWDISSASTQVPGLLFTLAGHASSIYGIEASPDGSRLVTASYDSTARIWDLTDNGTSEWLTISDGACCSAFYTPDGKRLIGNSRINTSLYGTNRMNVWDAATGRIIRTIDTGQICGGNLSRDGKRIVAVTCEKDLSHQAQVWDNLAKIWDVDTGNQLFSVPNPNADDPLMGFYGAAFHPDGTRVATATGKGNITIWDINSGKAVMTLSGHSNNVNVLAYSPDGTHLASSAETVKIWDAVSGKELRTLPTRGYGVTFSPDGTRLATAGMDGIATVWDIATGKALQTLRGHTGSIWAG